MPDTRKPRSDGSPRSPVESQTTVDLKSLVDRTSNLERRLIALEASQSPLSAFAAPAMTGVVGLLSIGGLWVVHSLSLRRQRREEFFKRTTALREHVREVSQAAANLWTKTATDDPARISAHMILSEVNEITAEVTLLSQMQTKFSVVPDLLEFKRLATLDLEDSNRKADNERAGKVLSSSRALIRAIDKGFSTVYG